MNARHCWFETVSYRVPYLTKIKTLNLKDQGVFIGKDGKPSRLTNVEWPVGPEETSSFECSLSYSGSHSSCSVHQALYCFYPSRGHSTCAIYWKLLGQCQRNSIIQPDSCHPNPLFSIPSFLSKLCHFHSSIHLAPPSRCPQRFLSRKMQQSGF